jgi:hypothetical protein
MTSNTRGLCYAALSAAALTIAALAPTPARADFFDDVRRTFQTDIPHFFQDDIPCAFGGQPTSGAKRACNDHAVKHTVHSTAPAPAPAASQPDTAGQTIAIH